MKQGYTEILKLRSFRIVLTANFINRLGDAIDMIAFTWMTYEITQSAGWSAIMFAVNQLPAVLFMPFSGALVEGMHKKQVIIFSDFMRGLCTALLACLFITNQLNIYWLLLSTFINNTFECFRIPAAAALLPHLLDEDQYDFGLSLNTSLTNTCELVGIAFSGVILAVIGTGGAIFIDAVSFFFCAGMFCMLSFHETAFQKKDFSLSAYIRTLKEGIRYIKDFKLLKILLCCSIFCNALLVPLNTYMVPFINGTLQLNEQAYSAFSFALTLGICIGTFLLPYLHKHFTARNLFLYPFCSVILFYAAMMAAPAFEQPYFICGYIIAVAFICGIGFGIFCNACSVSLIKAIDQDYLSRVTSFNQAVSRALMPITSFLLSLLSLRFTIPEIFCSFAVFTILAITGMMFSKTLKLMR